MFKFLDVLSGILMGIDNEITFSFLDSFLQYLYLRFRLELQVACSHLRSFHLAKLWRHHRDNLDPHPLSYPFETPDKYTGQVQLCLPCPPRLWQPCRLRINPWQRYRLHIKPWQPKSLRRRSLSTGWGWERIYRFCCSIFLARSRCSSLTSSRASRSTRTTPLLRFWPKLWLPGNR